MELKDFLPIPDLEACRALLCIQPHPDDNEIGAGATIAKLVSKGCRVTYLTVTNGNMGSVDPNVQPAEIKAMRRKEAEEAAAILGVTDCRFLDYADACYPDEKMLCRDIVSVIRKVRPDMIMTVDPFLPYEVHPDHIKVGMAAAQAFLFSPFPHLDPDTEPFSVEGMAFHSTAYPNTYIDVDKTWELKLKAIMAHKSQFGPAIPQELKYYFEHKARSYGAIAGFERAEAFKVLTGSHLHMNVDAIHL